MSTTTNLGRVGLVLRGEYSAGVTYEHLDVVTYQGSSYAAKTTTTGNLPTNGVFWQAIADISQALAENAAAINRANDAAILANAAADSANAAAETINIKAPAIECSAAGNPVSVSDSADAPLRGLKLFGKTTQDGTPTPDAPVELVSSGDDGNIGVTIEGGEADDVQTVAFATPNGLLGIPVTSGGNYTDDNGQNWVCDEIDLERGVYVQRVGQKIYDGSKNATLSTEGVFTLTASDALKIDGSNQSTLIGVKCSHYRATYWTDIASAKNTGCALKWGNGIGIRDNRFTTASEFSAFAQENPITVYYIMANPVETPLSAEAIAAFKALHTNKPNTTVINDSGAGMQLDYAADTKIYIDNKFAALAAAMVANA